MLAGVVGNETLIAAWKAHYGEQWPAVIAAKRKFDPQNILNPEFVKFE